MKDGRESTSLRAELARIERRGRGCAYPTPLRNRAVAYVQARRAEGASVASVGAELGICISTLLRWTRSPRKSATFERVLVVADAATPSALVVHGPCGLRIEGLQLAEVAELVRRLS
jgi:transposase-like protein